MKAKPRRTQPPEQKHDWRYRELWNVVDAAIFDAFSAHPDYLTDHGKQRAQVSIAKRVVGRLMNLIRNADRN